MTTSEKNDIGQIVATFPDKRASVKKCLEALLSKTGNVFPKVLALVEAVIDAQLEKPYDFVQQLRNVYMHLSPRGISELTRILEWFKVAPSLLFEKVMIMQDYYEGADGHLHAWYSSRPRGKEPDYTRHGNSRNGIGYRVVHQHRVNTPTSLDA